MFYERFLDKQLLKVQEHTTDPEAKSHITPFPQIRSYWSSTEAHKVGAWGVDAKVAKDPFYKDQKLYTRSILAF